MFTTFVCHRIIILIDFQIEKDKLFVEDHLLKQGKEIRRALFGLYCVAKYISVRDAFISYLDYDKKQI